MRLDRRRVDRALNDVDVIDPPEILMHNPVDGMREFQRDYVRCTVFGHPLGVHSASCSAINDQLAFEIIGRAECAFSNVLDPVRFEAIIVKVIPFVAEGTDRIAEFGVWKKTRYPVS